MSESFEELFSGDASSWVDGKLHLTDLLINLLHEVNDEVNQLVFVHLLCVEVCYQEADVIALTNTNATTTYCVHVGIFATPNVYSLRATFLM